MSYVQPINSLISLGSNAFLHNWSLVQREIELEFQIYKGLKVLQTSFGNPLSLPLNKYFEQKDLILMLKYYDNNVTDIFPLQQDHLTDNDFPHQQAFFLPLLEKYDSIKLLLSTSCQPNSQFSACLIGKREDIISNASVIEDLSISTLMLQKIYEGSYRGNFVLMFLECKNLFNFSFIVELLKLWSTLNGHIRFKARYIPSDLMDILPFMSLDKEIQELTKSIKVPWVRLPVNAEIEALLELSFGEYGYNSQTCYYETEEYFMNLQTIEENIISINAEFDLEVEATSFDKLNILQDLDIDLFCGLHISPRPDNGKGLYHVFSVIYYDKKPLFNIGDDLSSCEAFINNKFGAILEEALVDILVKDWKLKVSSDNEPNLQKKKSITRGLEIKAGVPSESSFQIIVMMSINPIEGLSNRQSQETLFELLQHNSKEIVQEIRSILAGRLEDIMEILSNLGIFMTRKLKNSNDIPEQYIPKLTNSLSNILMMFKDFILNETDENQSPQLKEILRLEECDKINLQEVLKQGVYNAIMKNKLKK